MYSVYLQAHSASKKLKLSMANISRSSCRGQPNQGIVGLEKLRGLLRSVTGRSLV